MSDFKEIVTPEYENMLDQYLSHFFGNMIAKNEDLKSRYNSIIVFEYVCLLRGIRDPMQIIDSDEVKPEDTVHQLQAAIGFVSEKLVKLYDDIKEDLNNADN